MAYYRVECYGQVSESPLLKNQINIIKSCVWKQMAQFSLFPYMVTCIFSKHNDILDGNQLSKLASNYALQGQSGLISYCDILRNPTSSEGTNDVGVK